MGTPPTNWYQATLKQFNTFFKKKSECLANGIMDYLVVSKICQHVVVFTSVDVARSTTQLNTLERVVCCTSSWDASPPASPSWCSEERPGRSMTSKEILQMMLWWLAAVDVAHWSKLPMKWKNMVIKNTNWIELYCIKNTNSIE